MRKIISMLVWLAALFCCAVLALTNELPAPAASPSISTTYYPPAPIYPEPKGDQVAIFHAKRIAEVDALAKKYGDTYYKNATDGIPILPLPENMPSKIRTLSIREAIMLSLRTNPAVQAADLQRILDKFSLKIAIQAYSVVWSPLTLTSTAISNAPPTWSAGTGIAVNAPTGTSVAITHANNLLGGTGSTQLTVTQQLLQGFGLQNGMINYENAVDTETSNKMTFKAAVMTDVITIITDYNNVVADYSNLENAKESLISQKETTKQTELEIKYGQGTPNNLTQQLATQAQTQVTYVQAQQQLQSDYQTLLSALGLPSTFQVMVQRKITVPAYKIPTTKRCIEDALKYNIGYQQALLAYNIDKRSLISAENARKWSLSVASNVTMGSERSAPGQPILPIGTNPNLTFSLSVPIDNVSLKQAVVAAQVAIENEKITLTQDKQSLIGQVVTQIESIQSGKAQVKFANEGVIQQEKLVSNAQLQLKYGQISSFEESTQVSSLLSQEQTLVSAETAYLLSIDTLYQTMGTLLDKWDIKLRY